MSKQPGKLKVVSTENIKLPIMVEPLRLKPRDIVIIKASTLPLQQIMPTRLEILAVDNVKQKLLLTDLRWYSEDQVMLYEQWATENFDD